jgi:hypothetical protein
MGWPTTKLREMEFQQGIWRFPNPIMCRGSGFAVQNFRATVGSDALALNVWAVLCTSYFACLLTALLRFVPYLGTYETHQVKPTDGYRASSDH